MHRTARWDEVDTALPEKLFKINSVAVVGASQNPDKVGYAISRNMLGFPGVLSPVDPNSAAILGKTWSPSLASIPGPVDVAVGAILDRRACCHGRCGRKEDPARYYHVFLRLPGTGPAGKALEEQALAIARKYGIPVMMGPNCLGFMLPTQGINTTFDPVSPRPGSIAFISQSGAIITTIVDWSLP